MKTELIVFKRGFVRDLFKKIENYAKITQKIKKYYTKMTLNY